MKPCIACRRELPLAEFYKHKQMADGHLNKCKNCVRVAVLIRRAENIEAIRAYDRGRSMLPHRIANATRVTREWRRKHPERQAAHNKARRATLARPERCEGCRLHKKLEKHHPDYSQPLLVVWLCKPCHAIADKVRRRLEAGHAQAS